MKGISVVSHKYLANRGEGFLTQARRERRAYPQGSVRSEQRSLRQKDPPPCGLCRNWPVASLLLSHRALAAMLLRRASPQANFGTTIG